MVNENRNEECNIKRRPSAWKILCWAVGLIVCVAMLVNIFGPLGDGLGIPLVNVRDTSSAPRYYGSYYSINKGGGIHSDPSVGVIVTARFIEAMPDTYTFYDNWAQGEFKLLHMEVVKVLSGKEIPNEFLLLMPPEYMTDYSQYDKLVIKMLQYTYDYSLVYNKTWDRPEQLNLAIFVDYFSDIKAFDSEGRFDMRLWESTEAWKKSVKSKVQYYGTAYYQNLTLQDEEQARYNPDSKLSANLLKDMTGEAAEKFAYIKSLENGTVVPYAGIELMGLWPMQLCCQRYIDGFRTNESGIIYADKVKWSRAKFTEWDMQRLPNLPAAMETVITALEAGWISPVHIQRLSKNADYKAVFGWYAKTNRGVIGIVRVNWCFGKRYDDAYYVIEYGSGICYPIDRDTLIAVHGSYETSYIYTGEYDENGKVNIYGSRP